MAADILIYDSNIVPVGQDQKQHVEITRDIAIKFNEQYGQTFVIPEPQIRGEVAKVPGLDGEKMSKSYGNTIEIFGDEKALRKKIMGIKMDSRTPQEPKPDADKNLAIQLLKLVAPPEVARRLRKSTPRGRPGLWRFEEGVVRALLELFCNSSKQASGVGRESGLCEQNAGGRSRKSERACAKSIKTGQGRKRPGIEAIKGEALDIAGRFAGREHLP